MEEEAVERERRSREEAATREAEVKEIERRSQEAVMKEAETREQEKRTREEAMRKRAEWQTRSFQTGRPRIEPADVIEESRFGELQRKVREGADVDINADHGSVSAIRTVSSILAFPTHTL